MNDDEERKYFAEWAKLRKALRELRDTDWSFIAGLTEEQRGELLNLHFELMAMVTQLATSVGDYLAVVAEHREDE